MIIETIATKLIGKGLGGLATLVLGEKGKDIVKKIGDFLGVSEDEILEKLDNPEIVKGLKELEVKEISLYVEEGAKTIRTEIQSDSWLAKNWRPLLMLLFGIIIANNYIIYPYLSLFFDKAPILKIPPDMWQLLKIG